jgi:cytochrome c peroxidase
VQFVVTGSESPLKDSFVTGFIVAERERADLIAFLESLTDDAFLTNPRLADPFTTRVPSENGG